MKKHALGIRAPVWTLAFCLFALVFTSCGEPGDPAKAPPLTPEPKKLSFDNVVIEYQKDSETELVNGFVFSKTKFTPSFEAEHDKAQGGYRINVAITAPPNIDWTLISGEDKETLKKSYKKLRKEAVDEEGKKTGAWNILSEPINPAELTALFIPRLDPLYDVFLPVGDDGLKSSYSEIKLTFELKLKAGEPKKFIDPSDGLEYE